MLQVIFFCHFFCILYDKSRDRSYFYYKFQYPHLVLGGGISQQEEGILMKPSKILSAGIVLVLAFCLAGCGTAQKKEEMKAPDAVAVKAGNVELTA